MTSQLQITGKNPCVFYLLPRTYLDVNEPLVREYLNRKDNEVILLQMEFTENVLRKTEEDMTG